MYIYVHICVYTCLTLKSSYMIIGFGYGLPYLWVYFILFYFISEPIIQKKMVKKVKLVRVMTRHPFESSLNKN